MPSAQDWVRSRWAIARGTVLGFFVGILPGAGPTVATFLSYAVEKKISKHPEEFGKGAIEGVAGPESANNAAATGAMVPMLTLGIPGSATTAIMLGGLMMWGLRPGPLLFEKNPQFVWGLIASQYIANVMLLILSTAFIPLFVRALRVPYGILMPIIIVFCVTGAYSLKNNVWDVGQMLVFGVLGYAMKKLGYSPAALVLALVLGPLAERALRQSLIISDSGIAIFFMRPIAAVLTVAALVAVAVPVAARDPGGVAQRQSPLIRERHPMKPLFNLDGKVALVSGAGRGMGRAMALALAEHGADLMLADRNAEGCTRTAAEASALGRRVATLACDVGDLLEIRALFASLDREFGRIDFLANVAGEGRSSASRKRSRSSRCTPPSRPSSSAASRCARKRAGGCSRPAAAASSTSARWPASRRWAAGTSPTAWRWARSCR